MNDHNASFPNSVWDGLTANPWRKDIEIPINPNATDFDRLRAEVIALETVAIVGIAGAAGAAQAVSGLTVQELGNGPVKQTVLTFTNVAVAVTDHTTSGASGSQEVYSFPAGLIGVLGAVANLSVVAAGGLSATAALLSAIGTVAAAADATLTSTEANISASASNTLSAHAGTVKNKSTAVTVLDGTASSANVFLNFAAADGDSTDSSNSTLTLNGTLTITWANFGDN